MYVIFWVKGSVLFPSLEIGLLLENHTDCCTEWHSVAMSKSGRKYKKNIIAFILNYVSDSRLTILYSLSVREGGSAWTLDSYHISYK